MQPNDIFLKKFYEKFYARAVFMYTHINVCIQPFMVKFKDWTSFSMMGKHYFVTVNISMPYIYYCKTKRMITLAFLKTSLAPIYINANSMICYFHLGI